MQKLYDEFEQRNTVVIAVAQEDKDLESHGQMRDRFQPAPKFEIVADIGRKHTQRYDRVTAYLIDKKGIVRQVFPMLIHARPSWRAIINEVERLKD